MNEYLFSDEDDDLLAAARMTGGGGIASPLLDFDSHPMAPRRSLA